MLVKFSPNHLLVCCSNNWLRVIKNIIVYYSLLLDSNTDFLMCCLCKLLTCRYAGGETGKTRLACVEDGED